MALTTSQLSDLRAKARIRLDMTEESAGYRIEAMTIYDDKSTNGSSSTVAVLYNETTNKYELQLVGNSSGTNTYDLDATSYDTLDEVIAGIRAQDEGFQVALVHPDGGTASNLLEQLPAKSIFGSDNERTLFIENQPKLDQIIGQAYESLITYMGRGLFDTEYTERIELGRDNGIIMLQQPNVTDVTFVGVSVSDAFTAKYTGANPRATVEVTDAAVVLRSRAGGTTTTSTLTFASNGSTSDLSTAIAAVSGWSSSLNETMPSAYLMRQGVRDAKNTTVQAEGFDDYDGDYSIDYPAGKMTFGWPYVPWNIRNQMVVTYSAGYTTLPEDIEGVLLDLIQDAWSSTVRDGSVTEERLGDYSYKVDASNSDSSSDMLARYDDILDRYARVLA